MVSQNGLRYPIKVMHVAETIRGGIASYLRDLIPLQVEEFGEDRIVVIAPEDQIIDLRLPKAVRSFTFSASYRNTLTRGLNGAKVARLTKRLLGRFEVENIHIHSSFAGLAVRAMVAARKQRPRIIYCPHGWAFLRKSRLTTLEILFERELSRLTDHIVCVSEHEQTQGLKIGITAERLALIPNGIPLQAPTSASITSPWPDDARLKLLFVGRFDRQKGIDILIKALRILKNNIFLCAAGSSVVDEKIPKLLPDNMALLGWQSPESLSALLDHCDALVMPSRWEGMPLMAIEAMRAGRAVIGTDIGGINEIVVDGVTGKLIPAEDIAALVSVLTGLTPWKCREMGQEGRKLFEQKFDLTRVHRSLVKLYEGEVEVGQVRG